MEAIDLQNMTMIHNPYRSSIYRNAAFGPITASTWTVVNYDTVQFDANGNVTIGTNAHWTCPINGYYYFSARHSFVVGASQNRATIGLFTSSTSGVGQILAGTDQIQPAAADMGVQTTGILKVNAGTTIYVQIWSSNSLSIEVGSTVAYYHIALLSLF